ncbi:ankyrin repeat domain-containing protein 9-like [Chanos chanos]|uniref:Ankyrin repeat domain-containing protein 9-like n=1 Tax=Chanos chanos TaxID=29144 RepID=A0A6J2WIY2_CHACN|nr:ankyrin repeat domain-containing protein 9-like [Chanos chanos]
MYGKSTFHKIPNKGCRQQMFQSVDYYRSVRDRLPVWKLEDIRLTELYSWDRENTYKMFSSSDALMYAIVHNHQAYAKYLLDTYPEEALTQTNNDHNCLTVSSHVMLSVRYDRREILNVILEVAQRLPRLRPNWILSEGFNLENGRSPLHLACELLQVETITMLLRNGASVETEDRNGATPVDVILEHLRSTEDNVVTKRRCLDSLVMFMTTARFKMQKCLRDDCTGWLRVLGQKTFNFLVGDTPKTLVLISMHRILLQIPTENFLSRLNALPIPSQLKPFSSFRGW